MTPTRPALSRAELAAVRARVADAEHNGYFGGDIPALLATVDALTEALRDVLDYIDHPPMLITDEKYWPELNTRIRTLLGDSEPREQPLGDDV